jgi:acyl-CoA thioesterase FadM
VWPSQIDINLHMNQSVFAKVLEVGRLDLVVRSGALKAWQDKGVNVVVAHQNITYRRELRLGTRYLLDTRPVALDGRLMLLDGYFLVGDRVHAMSRVGLLSVGSEGVLTAEQVAEMATPFLVDPLVVEDWRVVDGTT